MFKILFINPAAGLGGGELSLLDLLSSLGASVPDVERHLIATAEGPLLDRATALGVQARVVALPKRAAALGDSNLRGKGKLATIATLAARGLPAAPATWIFTKKLRRIIRDMEPTLIHTNGLKAHLLARFAAPRSIPVVWHVRDFPGSRPVMAHALRWASRRATGAIAISNAVARDVESVAPRLPVRVVYNAIDVDRFSPGLGDGARLDTLAGLPLAPAGAIRVGLVATFARWKGQDIFLDAAAKLDVNMNARFYVIGSPIYETRGSQFSIEELRDRAEALGLSGRVGFLPYQEQPAEVFRALDIVVHASTRPEPFGRTIVEAMACGKPTIVSNAGGAAELFQDGKDAVGFPLGDVAALAERIRTLAANADLRERIGRSARESAVARFSRDRLGPEVLKAYLDFGIGIA